MNETISMVCFQASLPSSFSLGTNGKGHLFASLHIANTHLGADYFLVDILQQFTARFDRVSLQRLCTRRNAAHYRDKGEGGTMGVLKEATGAHSSQAMNEGPLPALAENEFSAYTYVRTCKYACVIYKSALRTSGRFMA